MNRKTLILAGCLAAASLLTTTSTFAREAGERPRHEDRGSERQSDRQPDRRDERIEAGDDRRE